MALKEGMQVEARCNDEGYMGAWVKGIVRSIKRGVFQKKFPSANEKSLVKVKRFIRDNGNSLVFQINLKKFPSANEKSLVKVKKFLRDNGNSLVEVSVGNVRPIPPHSQLPLHCLDGVAVEAREKDCWGPGFIVRQVSCEGHTKTLTAYPLSCLRPAQEWQGGMWTSVPPEKNLNIGQVIRVLSAEETLKSSSQCEVTQGCSTSRKIQPVITQESSLAVHESKANQHYCKEPAVSSGLQMSFEQLKRTCLEEQNQHCNEAQEAKEGVTEEVQEAKEGATEVVQAVYRARPAIIVKKFYRRRHPFSMREF